jgi:biopolymer transport protein ExbD
MAAQTIRSPAMGTAVCGGKRGPVSDPNIVPLIDVLLVLIIIFMVITPSVPTGLPALVPTPESKPEPVDPRIIVVQVMQNGKLMMTDATGTPLAHAFLIFSRIAPIRWPS